MKRIKKHPFLEKHYQMILAEQLTGKKQRTIEMYMRRHELTLAEAVLYYLQK